MTLFEEVGEISPRWESWKRAFDELHQEQGDWWIVSPFITADPGLTDLRGARILTTLESIKLSTDLSNLDLLLDLKSRGAQVKLLDALHAKAYLRRAADRAVGYVGSANLTHRADRMNKEVMSGPHRFSSIFLRQLDRHWAAAEFLTDERAEDLRREAQRLDAVQDIRIFTVETRIFRGHFSLTEAKVRVPPRDRTPSLSPASLPFLSAAARDPGSRLIDEAIEEAMRPGSDGASRRLPGDIRLYAVSGKAATRFRERMERAHRDLRQLMLSEQEQHGGRWREDFRISVERSLNHYNRAVPEVVADVMRTALTEFDACMAGQGVEIVVSEYLPVVEGLGHTHLKVFESMVAVQGLGFDPA